MVQYQEKYGEVGVIEYANRLGGGGCKNKNPFA